MPLVLFNTGWMKHYRGVTRSDRVFNGGDYVEKNKTGLEIRNFEPLQGRCYGYASPSGGQVNMRRLDVAPDAPHANDVTVVFTATRPQGGTVVVGWYQNARVWRTAQLRQERRGCFHFAEARREDCTLLEVDERVFRVPRTGRRGEFVIGRSNIRYTDELKARPFVRKLLNYMNDPSAPDAVEPGTPGKGSGRGGVPRQPDPELRTKVENAAIDHVKEHYRKKGYRWRSVETENKGWDLEFTRQSSKLLVEVKGCSGKVGQVELTPNEYAAMNRLRNRDVYRLAIVTSALEAPRLSIVSFNGSDESWRDQDDRKVLLEPRTGARVRIPK